MKSQALKLSPMRLLITLSVLTAITIYSAKTLAADDVAANRVSITTQNTKVLRDNGVAGIVTEDEFTALDVIGERSASKRASGQLKSTPQALLSSNVPNVDFWFYSADVVLFNDQDRDGYYHGIDLLFDADTYYTVAEVYAVVYLSFEGGPWNEYGATENFTIFGTSSDDDYVLVSELLEGYPTGSYDILVELFDAYDDSFLAWIGPEDTSELAFLPLEDANRDAAVVPEVIVVNRGGGGSLGWLLILALALTAAARRRVWRCA
jgi:hypothetical protein